MEDPAPRSKPVTSAPKSPAVKIDLSKYAECSAREAVEANLAAGVYDRTGASLERDLAALPLADS